jgi:hypothetical protein
MKYNLLVFTRTKSWATGIRRCTIFVTSYTSTKYSYLTENQNVRIVKLCRVIPSTSELSEVRGWKMVRKITFYL